MFRKTTSNKGLDDSKREIFKTESALKAFRFISSRPRTIYFMMLISMLLSIGYGWFNPRPVADPHQTDLFFKNSFQKMNSELPETLSLLMELTALQKELAHFVEKDSFSKRDSLFLEAAFEKLQNLENQFLKVEDSLPSP